MKELIEEQVEGLRREAEGTIRAAETEAEIERLRVELFGRKGRITALLHGIAALPPAERPAAGQMINSLRDHLTALLEERAAEIAMRERERRLANEAIDVTLPGRKPFIGSRHPINLVRDEIVSVFRGMGYVVYEGPEVEYDYFNFEALNIPKTHPAREMQDSFYVTGDILLRTHTSPAQIRYMRQVAPRLPVRMVAPGRVFRRDDDATHSPMFHQVEGLLVDHRVSLGDLKGTLLAFAQQVFGEGVRIRLRPSYFPFTEPSAEVDISCTICGGSGFKAGDTCRTCKGTGWLEVLGAGMVHPNVLRNGGYDPQQVSGFAFGMGIERIAMLKYGIDDLRLFYQNDLRFLRQF